MVSVFLGLVKMLTNYHSDCHCRNVPLGDVVGGLNASFRGSGLGF